MPHALCESSAPAVLHINQSMLAAAPQGLPGGMACCRSCFDFLSQLVFYYSSC